MEIICTIRLFEKQPQQRNFACTSCRPSSSRQPAPMITLVTPSLRTARRKNWLCLLDIFFIIPSSLIIMSGCGNWQSKDSTKTVDICPICMFSYPACQTCQKYGKQSHILDQEKSSNAHDNQAYLQTEEKDPRKK